MYRLSFFFIRIALIDLRDETVPGRRRCSRKETDLKSAEKVSKIPAVLSVNRSENSPLNALCFTFSLAGSSASLTNAQQQSDAAAATLTTPHDASRRPTTELFSGSSPTLERAFHALYPSELCGARRAVNVTASTASTASLKSLASGRRTRPIALARKE